MTLFRSIPNLFERLVMLACQWCFYLAFFGLYRIRARTAHRVVGYFEEEAVISYTLYLEELESGRSPDLPAPAIARHYWKLGADATLRDVVLVVRADEAHHRDVNHGFACELAGREVDPAHHAPYPEHADDIRSEEHTSELQSLMRISYAVFCLKKKTNN